MMIPSVRGACPRLNTPMQTGDGLLARIVPAGRIPMDAFASLCAAAQTHGNGLIEVSARGSIQVRGLSTSSALGFAGAVEALDIVHSDTVPVLANPLPQGCGAYLENVVAELRTAIAARNYTLAPKVSVIVDDGGPISFDPLAADIRLNAIADDAGTRLHVSLGGDARSSISLGLVAPESAARLVCDLLEVLDIRGPRSRARDVLASEGLRPFQSATRVPLKSATARPALRAIETIGLHRLKDGHCAIGISLPFGQIQALDLIALLRIAQANGATWAATAPQRTLLLGPIDEMTAFALGTAADTLGFVVDARDPRRRVVACAGAPACRSGLIPARTLAADIASALPQGRLAVHVSGCTKSCAHQGTAPLTIVGTTQGGMFVKDGTVHDEPDTLVSEEDIVVAAIRAVGTESTDA